MSLTTLAEAKAYMSVKSGDHDAEIARLVAQADGVVQNMAVEALQRATFVERHPAASTILLNRCPIVSLTSVSLVTRGVVGAAVTTGFVLDASTISSPFAYSTVEVTYVAGPLVAPPEAVDAALVFVSYKYRRNHGGSESYMPAGVDGGIAPPMGVGALEQQIRLALGQYARGALIG